MRHIANVDRMDLRHVVEHLSVQNDAERGAIGLTKNQLIELLYSLALAGPSEVAMSEGQPIAAYGVKTSPDGQFNDTWFVATSRYFELGVGGFRFSRVRLKYFRERYGLPLRALSWSPVAEAPKWFRSFGFVEVGSVDGCRAFIYR